MKNLVKKGLLIAMLSLAMVTMASGVDNSIRFTVLNSKLIDLKLQNYDGELQISVKDYQGEVLHSEMYNGSNFSKKYDLKNLPNGDYFFEIEGETKIKLIPFEVKSKDVAFEGAEKVFYKPTVRKNDDLIHISKIAFSRESLTIALFDENSNALYAETVDDSSVLGRTLNVKNLNDGSYKLVLKSGDYVFNEQISIEK